MALKRTMHPASHMNRLAIFCIPLWRRLTLLPWLGGAGQQEPRGRGRRGRPVRRRLWSCRCGSPQRRPGTRAPGCSTCGPADGQGRAIRPPTGHRHAVRRRSDPRAPDRLETPVEGTISVMRRPAPTSPDRRGHAQRHVLPTRTKRFPGYDTSAVDDLGSGRRDDHRGDHLRSATVSPRRLPVTCPGALRNHEPPRTDRPSSGRP